MKRGLFILSFILLTLNTKSQMAILPASDLFKDYSGQIRSTIDKRLSTIAGSPYLYENFRQGIVYPKNYEKGFNIDLNINAYSNMFEFIYDGDHYEMPNYKFDSVIIGKSKYIPVSVFNNDIISFYTMEVLDSDGKGNYLVKQPVVKFLEATSARAYHQPTPARYQPFPPNYYIYESGNPKLISMRNLRWLSKEYNLPESVKDFIRKNRIRPRKVDDLKELFRFLYINKENE